jgi:hypothetical protein
LFPPNLRDISKHVLIVHAKIIHLISSRIFSRLPLLSSWKHLRANSLRNIFP